VAVFKFASCDGCQLTMLDCEDELMAIAGAVDICYFPEATRKMIKGPYEIGFVEGSITTHHDAKRIQQVRKSCSTLVTLGACATAGGIQALRNWADTSEFVRAVYARPEYVSTLKMSTPVAEHVPVDLELRGCPISKEQLIEVISALLAGRKPQLPASSVCQECKMNGTACLLLDRDVPCLGPVTQAGCRALCPAMNRGCFGCFGPTETANTEALTARFVQMGLTPPEIRRLFRTYNGWTWQFRHAGEEVTRS
jgi:coenzyme F420-reducing hydrogenase gamma subunit